jgi:DNA-binding transcriptional LysR family regulator
MRIRYVEIFYAVMTTGTVKRASEVLNITQPAATRLLQQAEVSIGFPLFERVRGRLVPTREAHLLFPEVEQIFLKLSSIKRTVANFSKGTGESLRIHCVPSLSLTALPPAINAIKKRFPNLIISLKTLHSRQIEEAVALRECDLGITFESASNPAVKSEAVAKGALMAAGKGLKGKIGIDELAKLDVIDLDDKDPLGRRLAASRLAQNIEFRAVCTVESYQTAMALAAHHVGIAIVDSFTAKSAASALNLGTALIYPELDFQIYVLTSALAPNSVPRDAFITEVEAILNKR